MSTKNVSTIELEKSKRKEAIHRKQQLDRSFSRAYESLVAMASSLLNKERSDHQLQSADLVHEVYLRLLRQRQTQWGHESQLLGLSHHMMRRIIIDHVRSGLYAKRGGGASPLPLEEVVTESGPEPERLDTNECLENLAAVDDRQAKIVILRCIRGFTGEEIAVILGISSATVHRQWRKARAWLSRHYTGNFR